MFTAEILYFGIEKYFSNIIVIKVHNLHERKMVPKPRDRILHSDTILLCGNIDGNYSLLVTKSSKIHIKGEVYYFTSYVFVNPRKV